MTINGVTYGLIYLSALPLLFILWRLGKATIGIQSMVFLGMLGFLFLMPWIDALIPDNLILALALIMAGVDNGVHPRGETHKLGTGCGWDLLRGRIRPGLVELGGASRERARPRERCSERAACGVHGTHVVR